VFWGVIQKDVCVRTRGANCRDKRNANEVLCFMVHYAIVCIFYIILRAIVCCYITFESPFSSLHTVYPNLKVGWLFFSFFVNEMSSNGKEQCIIDTDCSGAILFHTSFLSSTHTNWRTHTRAFNIIVSHKVRSYLQVHLGEAKNTSQPFLQNRIIFLYKQIWIFESRKVK